MRKVHVQWVVVADTVEDRILKMQERKVIFTFVECFWVFHSLFSATLADGGLGERSGKKIGSEYSPSVRCGSDMPLIPECFENCRSKNLVSVFSSSSSPSILNSQTPF